MYICTYTCRHTHTHIYTYTQWSDGCYNITLHMLYWYTCKRASVNCLHSDSTANKQYSKSICYVTTLYIYWLLHCILWPVTEHHLILPGEKCENRSLVLPSSSAWYRLTTYPIKPFHWMMHNNLLENWGVLASNLLLFWLMTAIFLGFEIQLYNNYITGSHDPLPMDNP